MIYFELFFEFFKIGLFSMGGGLATLPFLNKLVDSKQWYSTEELANLIAVSESTPGAIGVNMATYVGYLTADILGSIVATFALVLPSYIIIIMIYKILDKFRDSKYILNLFDLIRPVVTGLIGVSFVLIFESVVLLESDTILQSIDFTKLIIFIIISFLILKLKKHPIFYIALGGVLGFILKLS